jgi:hypothetical protein
MNSMARRMFELVEPIGVIPYSADEPNEARFALGFTNYWDTYFAGRAAPLGVVPAEVVDALFYNFAYNGVAIAARHPLDEVVIGDDLPTSTSDADRA